MTSNSPPVVIVDPYSAGAYLADLFYEKKVPLIAVISQYSPPDEIVSSLCRDRFLYVIKYNGDLDLLVTSLNDFKPRCILPGFDSGVELADILSQRLTPFFANSQTTNTARRDKWEMALALSRNNLAIIPQICTNSAEDVSDWIIKENLRDCDLVLKPPLSAGTDSVHKASATSDWHTIFNRMMGSRNILGTVNDKVLVQKYQKGIEYVVDTFSYNGHHAIAGICQYKKIEIGEQIAVYESLQWLPLDEPSLKSIIPYALDTLDAVGLKNGLAHIEIIDTDSGPKLIEINARCHGAGGPRLCFLATGDSQAHRAVQFFSGNNIINDVYTLKKHVVLIFPIIAKSGIVRNAQIFDSVGSLSSYHYSHLTLKNGERINVSRNLFDSFANGCIILAHEDPLRVRLDYAKIREIEKELVIE